MTNNKMNVLSSFLCLLMFCPSDPPDTSSPRVNTHQGVVRGYTLESRGGRTIYAFSGIPFAKPPVGDRRFKDPQEPDLWETELHAKKRQILCVQFISLLPILSALDLGNEDCLYLSVYSTDLNAMRPVILYVHGGAYTFGSATSFKGPQYFMDEDVVIVSANYRLGALGFLSLEDETIPGNYGAKDQVMALRWIQKNIKSFGGDPQRVTVMGESAGGASAHMMTLSPLTKGLIHGSISESGTALGPWAVSPPGRARQMGLRLVELVNCKSFGSESQEILECLRTKSKRELLAAHRKLAEEIEEPTVVFNPVVDSKSQTPFLPVSPWTTNLSHPVPWLTGIVKYDGVVRTSRLSLNPRSYEAFSENYVKLLKQGIGLEWTSRNPERVAQLIWDYYVGKVTATRADFENITYMYGDAYYLSGLETALTNHKGVAYQYYFTYESSKSFAPLYGGKENLKGAVARPTFQLSSKSGKDEEIKVDFPACLYPTGPVHTDDTVYLWYSPELFGRLRGNDLILSKKLVKIMATFAGTGMPEPYGQWKPWDVTEKHYIDISNNGLNARQKLLENRVAFWAKLSFRDKLSWGS